MWATPIARILADARSQPLATQLGVVVPSIYYTMYPYCVYTILYTLVVVLIIFILAYLSELGLG
jgi:capsule polysaccharide export protein KpsE/RkpR